MHFLKICGCACILGAMLLTGCGESGSGNGGSGGTAATGHRDPIPGGTTLRFIPLTSLVGPAVTPR
jgi:hypothetical protein